MPYQDLPPDTARRELAADPELRVLDVRTAPEHHSHRLPQAIHIPVQEIHARFEELDARSRYLVYCEHGVRSLAACEFLDAQGFEVCNLRGGMAGWIGEGLPFER